MKTQIKLIAAAILIAMTTSVNLMAFEGSLNVSSKNSIDLVINDVYSTTIITLKDAQNNILFEQSIEETEKFAKSLNLEQLPDGDYFIEIDNNTKVKIMPVSIKNDIVNVSESEMNEQFKPVVNEKDAMVYISQFSPTEAPLSVFIYNETNELIYTDVLKGKMDLGKVFDFSDSMEGQYHIYLESNGMSYDHLVYIQK